MTQEELESLREGWDFEAKKAGGRDGRGVLPESFWETYSAMANGDGGRILLGASERRDGSLELHGIEEPERVERHLWDQLQDRHKVSANLLVREHVQAIRVNDRSVLLITVPRARRAERPVYVGRDLWSGTYVRLHEGDRTADRERIRRMLADAAPTPADAQVLPGFTLEDIDRDSLDRFRNLLSARRADHPFLQETGIPFLRLVRAWALDRETGKEGPTRAGLLMLGREAAIRDQLPHFNLDYRELPDEGGLRWVDRIHPDGTWNANLLQFYLRVIPRLHEQLRVPFHLSPDLFRRDETPIHAAVREALVNTLIHADYSGRTGVRVLRRPGRFDFVNPGTLLLPLERIRAGGASECRNPNLQHMFTLVGLGERAGSGFPAIVQAWREQHWRGPLLMEDVETQETTLTLHLESLLPIGVLETLEERFGVRFRELDEHARLVLAVVFLQGPGDHERLTAETEIDSRELTLLLQKLQRWGFLERMGSGRGCRYQLPGGLIWKGNEPRAPRVRSEDSTHKDGSSSTHSEGTSSTHRLRSGPDQGSRLAHSEGMNSTHSGNSTHNESSEHQQNSLDGHTAEAASGAPRMVASVGSRPRSRPEHVEEAILALCLERFMPVQELADHLHRSERTLQQNYLRRMVSEGRLEMLYPDKPNHPAQAYRTINPSANRDP